MAEYALTNRAAQDLTEIYHFSVQQFGARVAGTYLNSLDLRFSQLAEQPKLGRPVPQFRPGYFRNMCLRHAIFYTQTPDGILVVRVLHQRMDFSRHLRDE